MYIYNEREGGRTADKESAREKESVYESAANKSL